MAATKSKSSKAKKTSKTNGSKKVAGKTPRAESKMAKVRAMMQRASGCTRAQILELTGWRAVSPQQIAEKAGLKIKLEKVEGKPTVYRA
jgi:hypothetical protein